MAEIRFNPLTRDWVMIASHRQARPQMPKDWCPFCPGSGKVPDEGYDVLRYPNDFPALSVCPPEPDVVSGEFFRAAPAYGRCEVLLYSPGHDAKLRDLPDAHMGKLSDMWLDCYRDFASDEKIKYVMIFENRGEAVGVTMPHPHGQVYGYPFIPKKLEVELDANRRHLDETGRCLFCDILDAEHSDGQRIIFENEFFTVFLPFASEYPYGIQIMANRHASSLQDLSERELKIFGYTVRDCVGMLDSLFDSDFPYMMCMHGAPVNSGGQPFHFHVEFFPPMRSADKQKFNASSETGAWAHCNPTCPEEKAAELRAAYTKYKQKS